MSPRARVGLVVALVLGGLGALSFDPPAPAPAGSDPLYAEARSALAEMMRGTADQVRVPVEWAAPRIGRLGLSAWLATLDLPPEVRARIDARVGSADLVDELVPFALFVKETYADPGVPTFDTWARTHLTPDPAVPGWETSLFTFRPPAETEAKGGAGLSGAQAVLLLRLYDAAYLQGREDAATVGDRLACESDDVDLSARTERARPVLRELLGEHRASLVAGDIRDGVDRVLADDATLTTITTSLLEFVDDEVCKHYGVFATQVGREHGLNAWLGAALTRPGDPTGWEWLRWHRSRRMAVHVVVDGLQGRLVESLAGEDNTYLKVLVEEAEAHRRARPAARSTVAGPPSPTPFLAHAAATGARPFLPNLAAAVASPGFARHGISTTPTISVRNLPVAKTGAPVAGPNSTGIPNFHFVDRSFTLDGVQQGRPLYFYGNDALQLTDLAAESGMRTMFSRLGDLTTMSCGAQYDEEAGYSLDAFLNLALGERLRDFADTRCVAELRRRAANEARIRELEAGLLARMPLLAVKHHPWEWVDRWAQAQEREAVLAEVAELAALYPESMPDYLLYYNPWPDHFAHPKGPYADEVIGPVGELKRLDHWLGELAAVYAQAGVSDRVLWGMAGDHGLSTVHWIVSPEAEFVDGLARAGVKLEVAKISSDEGEGPKLTNRLRPPTMRGHDVVVASTAGGNYLLDFFVDQDENWARQPVYAELQALRTLGGKVVDVPAELSTRLGDSLDYLVVRESPCTPETTDIRVIGCRRGGLSTAGIQRKADRIRLQTAGPDLLDLAVVAAWESPDATALAAKEAERTRCLGATDDPATWCTETEWRELSRYSTRPDAVVQLAHLYDTDRAGTVNLFPREGVGYNTQVPGRHAGESFAEKDAFVGLWGKPVVGEVALPPMVNGSVPMALYAWVSGERPEAGKDGWGWPAWPAGLVAEGG